MTLSHDDDVLEVGGLRLTVEQDAGRISIFARQPGNSMEWAAWFHATPIVSDLRTWAVLDAFVADEFRRRGIAMAVHDEIERRLVAMGCRLVIDPRQSPMGEAFWRARKARRKLGEAGVP